MPHGADPEQMIAVIDIEIARVTAVLTERDLLRLPDVWDFELKRKLLSELRAMYERDLMPDEDI